MNFRFLIAIAASLFGVAAIAQTKPKPIQIVLVCPQSELQQLLESGFLKDGPTEEYLRTLDPKGFHLKKLDDLHYVAAYIAPPKEINGVSQAKIIAVWKKVINSGVPVALESLAGEDRKIMTDLFKMMTGFNPEPGSVISASIENTKSVRAGGKTYSVTDTTTEKKNPKESFKGLPCTPVKPEERLALTKTYGVFMNPYKEPHTTCFNWSTYATWDLLPSYYSKAIEFYGGLVYAAQKKVAEDWREYSKDLSFKDGAPQKPMKSNDPAVQALLDKLNGKYGPGADAKEISRETYLNLTFVYNNAGKTESFGISNGLGNGH